VTKTTKKLIAMAYPEFSAEDNHLIENYRKEHDSFFKIVKAHFTFVFAIEDITADDFIIEIKKQLEPTQTFSFCLRSAVISKDAFEEIYHVFLVPDEGYSHFVKLHDKLYDGKLIHYRRFDLDYIPHIGIATSSDKMVSKKMGDEWNSKEFAIKGSISTIDIVEYENEIVTTIERIKLD
jgi:hypothetical protein